MNKAIFIVAFFLFITGFQQAFAQFPIPSYDQSVKSRANFQESQSYRGRRNMNVKVKCVGITSSATCQATVWIYSLDGQTVFGPYTVNGGETLTVEIDDREWGVLVQTNDEITVDIWTSALDNSELQVLTSPSLPIFFNLNEIQK